MPTNDDEVIYHYTHQKGFLGILESRVLWATKIQYLNDARELIGVLKLADEILQTKESEPALTDAQRQILHAEREAVRDSRNINIPVVSFSADGDSLGQWRAYSQDGVGYAIGFDKRQLESLCQKQELALRRCEYLNAEEYRERINALVAEHIASKLGYSWLVHELLNMASTLKPESFHEEREWRTVPSGVHGMDDLVRRGYTYLTCEFRSGRSMIVPYWNFRLAEPQPSVDPLPIKKVIIGPGPHPELAKEAVTGRLHAPDLNLGNVVKVENSKIPYRNW